VAGRNAADYLVNITADGLSRAMEDVSGLPAVIEFDAGSLVLTAFGRVNAGTIRVTARWPTRSSTRSSGSDMSHIDLAAIEAQRARLRAEYLADPRPSSSARGIHHTALLCSDVERTIRFYQGILGFPLTEIIENRDYKGSNHFFFDVGNGNLLAFFDFPGLDLGPYAEVLGGLHHIAISVTPEAWAQLRGKLDAARVPYQEESGTSLYFRDPDGARLELLADPLGEMYGHQVL
jgi:catechol 2,3-dioxygenase-like lactoylglutathione lyase family enzyme